MVRLFQIVVVISLVLIASGIFRERLGLPAEWLIVSGLIVVILNAVCLTAIWRRRAAPRNSGRA